MFTGPARITRTAILHMQRHGWHTLAAISIMTLTFFMMSLFILTLLAANQVLRHLETQPFANVFMKTEATEQQITELQADIQATGLVQTVKYVSPQEASEYMKAYQEELSVKGREEVIRNMPTVTFPASLEITPNRIEDLSQVSAMLASEEYDAIIDDIHFNEDLADQLATWVSTGRLVGLVLIGFLLTVSFFIMLVTIGLNISAFKDEIEVMRLVGASNWYIRGPFLLEGILYGAISALIAVTIVYASLPWVAEGLKSFLNDINIFPIAVLPVFGSLLLGQILFGTLLGIIGSNIAMRRSLKT